MRLKPGKYLAALALSCVFAGAAQAGVAENLQAKGFDCKVFEDGADICTVPVVKTKDFKYGMPIGILVPHGVARAEKILIHIHGFQNVCHEKTLKTPAATIRSFNLYAGMKQAGIKNAVLVLPISYGQMSSHYHSLLPQFGSFVAWAGAQVDAPDARIHLSGHSGAGAFINFALAKNPEVAKKTDNVVLFDTAGYTNGYTSSDENWRAVIKANPDIKIHTVYRPGKGSEKRTAALQKAFPINVVRYKSGGDHCSPIDEFYGRLLPK